MSAPNRDRVERNVLIRGSLERVFAALTDASLFPTWGPLRIEGQLEPGERPVLDFGSGGGGKVAIYVVAFEAPRYFAYRWAQGATDPAVLLGDPLQVPNTLVEFELEPVEEGTRVTVTESGIAALPVPCVPGVDPDQGLENMGEGWRLMLGGLARSFETGPGTVEDGLERHLTAPRSPEEVFATLTGLGWWAQAVDGTVAEGESVVLDFGPFGKSRIHVVALEPTRRFAFVWRPLDQNAGPEERLADPRGGPNTTATFELEAAPEGTRITFSERGFTTVPNPEATFERARHAWGFILGMLESVLQRA